MLINKIKIKIKNYLFNSRLSRPIYNYYKTEYSKKALISYIVHPFFSKSFDHTNYYEAHAWAQILNELGFQVDIIDYNNSSTSSLNLYKYDLICGFGDVFQKYFETNNLKGKTIYYGTGMHVCHQNKISLERVKSVYQKKGVWLGKSARFVEKTWSHQTTLVDGIIALGNNICANSYKKYYNGIVYSVPAPFYKTQDIKMIMSNRSTKSKNHFLWFGGSGMVHKGLDLLLEYFSKNREFFLHICGPVNKEELFVETYKNELFKCSNIKLHGFVNIKNEIFAKILESCSFVIFPSCSEGGAAGLLTVIGNGGLIPIITKETTVETGNEIWIDDLSYNGIDKAIQKTINLSNNDIIELQKKNYDYVNLNHSQKKYYNKLKYAIKKIIGKNNEM